MQQLAPLDCELALEYGNVFENNLSQTNKLRETLLPFKMDPFILCMASGTDLSV